MTTFDSLSSPRKWVVRLGGGLFAFLLAGHFTLACLSAANIPISKVIKNATATKLLLVYQYLSGTGNNFGFFAPGVISMLKVSYEIQSQGKKIGEGVITSENDEVSLRMHNLTQQFWTASKKPEVRRSFAASIAGKLFSQYPRAEKVKLTIHSYALPSMAQYREGQRPSWEKNYETTFDKKSGT